MKRIINIIRAIVVLLLLCGIYVAPVMADSSVDISVYATPLFTNGVLNFQITYVSATDLHLTWDIGANTTNVMVRRLFGAYPKNIASPLETPSDGTLIYYGAGTSADDTNIDLENNLGRYYYVAWAQKADGTWYTNISSGWKETTAMTLIAIISFAIVLTLITIWKPEYLWAIMSSGAWGVLLWYILNNPINGIVNGSAGSNTLVLVLYVGIVAPPIYTFMRMRSGKKERIIQMNKEAEKENRGTFYNSKGKQKTLGDLTSEEYRSVLHSKRVKASGK